MFPTVVSVIISEFAIRHALQISSKVCIPEFESNKICEEFSPRNKRRLFSVREMKIQIFPLQIFSSMSVDTTCDRKFGIGITFENFVIFRTTYLLLKVEINCF